MLSAPGQVIANAIFDTFAAVTPDGTTFDAAAVQAGFQAQFDNPLIDFGLRPFYPTENATEVIDEFTIQYNLLDPNAQFPAAFSTQGGYIASPMWLAAALVDPTLSQAPVGTGPFKIESRTLDSVTRVVRNDEWWGGDVYLDAMEFLPISDPDTRTDLLNNGDLQAIQMFTPDGPFCAPDVVQAGDDPAAAAPLVADYRAVDPSLDLLFLICRTIDVISLNFARYCTDERDALIAEAQATTNDGRRAELWQEIARQINDAATYVFLDHTACNNAFRAEVKGVCDRTSPDATPLRCSITGATWFDSVWLDQG